MDPFYFRQIALPIRQKADLARGLMRFAVAKKTPVERGRPFDMDFVEQSRYPPDLHCWRERDPYLLENVNRIFWVCCEMGFLRYQYPYPHTGQTYLPTWLGRIFSGLPRPCAQLFMVAAYALALFGWPIKHFHRLRDLITLVAGLLAWWHQHTINSTVFAIAIGAGVVATWIAGLLAEVGKW